MKTFSTSGTGNQQTLTEIESDKIPIYDSLTDVTADLANLTEGQIVATKDTGSELSAPVDTVQSENMHAVTSNAVAESLSYSTTEQKTGGTWIDGKPIYRKVLYPTTAALQHGAWGLCGFPSTIMSNVETCIKASAITVYHDRLQYYVSDILVMPDLGFFTITADLFVGSLISIEYTKTTD